MFLRNNILYFLLTLSFTFLFSCSKKEEEVITPNVKNNSNNHQSSNYAFTVGNYDSATYYLYQPTLDLTYIQNFPGYYGDTDTFDLDFNSTPDIALKIYGFADGFISGSPNFVQIDLFNLNNYEFVCNPSNNLPDTMNYGDTLKSNLNWINQNSFLLKYSSSSSQNDGNWHIGWNKKYIGFRSITNDTLMGWFSLEGTSDNGVALRITDCAIENP